MPNMKNRDTMVASLPHNGKVAEIGVQQGTFAHTILLQNEPAELHLIDCWEHQTVEVYGHDPANTTDNEHSRFEAIVRKRFTHNPEVHIVKSYSVEASKKYPDYYFDWLYLDANHIHLLDDLHAWQPKVKSGGWITGHDYCVFGDFINVQPILDKYIKEIGATLFVVEEEDFPSWAYQV